MRPDIDFHAAKSVAEACALLVEDPQARVITGGTALALLLRQGLVRPSLLIGLGHLSNLRQIDAGEWLHLGASVRLRTAERHPGVRQRWPVVAETLGHVATPRIRNMASIGGGLAHADPAQDPPATFVALEAQVRVAGPDGERQVPAAEFFVDYYETVLQPAEVVVGVDIPPLPPGSGAAFEKFTPRSVDDYATVSACAVVQIDAAGVVHDARLVLGAAGVRPVVVHVAETLRGRQFDESAVREAAAQARSVVDPLDDVRGSAGYKRDMAVVFGRRALTRAAARARQAISG